jgi:predicted RNA methylase
MNVIASHVKDQRVKTILDLGCGTGRFSEALAVHFDPPIEETRQRTRLSALL